MSPLAIVPLVLAFAAPESFRLPADVGGGGGRMFTGSPSAKWDCSVCHDADPSLAADVASEPAGLFTSGYEPGTRYRLIISLSEETNGAFGLEASSGVFSNVPLGELGAMEKCTIGGVERDPIVVRGNLAQSGTCSTGTRSWRVDWTAPASEAGPVSLYLAAVAGNKNALSTGDKAVARIVGVPSPGTVGKRSQGCGAPAGVMLLPLFALVLVRRRGLAVLLLMISCSAWAAAPAAKRKRPSPAVAPAEPAPAPAPAVEAPVAAPPSEPEPEPAAASPAPPPAPLTPALSPTGEREVVVELPPALEVSAAAGFGYRALSQYSASFAIPLRQPLSFPLAALTLRFYPLRLLRVNAGLELEGRYQIGWAVGALPIGAAAAMPADGRLALGWRIEAGPVAITPRVTYRVEVGGVERNALFDDPFYQSIGGGLGLGLHVGGFLLELEPQAGKVLDTGTASTKGYGALTSGFTAGGSAGAGWRFGESGFALVARYALSFTRVSWAGYGERDLAPVTSVDLVHSGTLTLSLAR